ncbi:glycosyltransferase family 2 protein [Magnetovibrio blakemorei]|uniref:Glycosyl transferase n=1 Tax=Magnetovibrio blakemorei TaxID=28181 RepID=A0A1E5Q3A5_9PROT|nr:glycosyltransferase family 2 protein [Magnetovibrio blakemorei]OEJ64095.1 glycosyl transferase [Magnetovibrio blakemorei]
MHKLSVVIPCYNEEKTLAAVVAKVLSADTAGLELEVIIVDDCSSDGSAAIAQDLSHADPRLRVHSHATNQGKGAALRTGFAAASGDLVIVQDADQEYDPADYVKLLGPILDGTADVVYGSRFLERDATEVHFLLHGLANRFLTSLSNLMTGLKLTDMETCYKLVPKALLERLTITENRFGIEPEITAKLAHMLPKPRIVEVAISYVNRSYDDGKKIGWKDGISTIRCIFKFSLMR